ncbi:MAG: PilT/PilU family type 4a pilus ATPase, partial [Planctomycetota bacterium]|nr:PilT/PilU family type 4a pilus ATPase [Planctomycetota bacterium]
MTWDIGAILADMIKRNASDLHLKVGRPPLMRIGGDLLPTEYPIMDELGLTEIAHKMMPGGVRTLFEKTHEADFSYSIPDLARFRVNIFRQLGLPGIVIRAIPLEIPAIDSLGLPSVLKDMVQKRQGLILVTGPTGSGKSTSLAAMVDHVNATRHCHIVTIEDPVEFVYTDNLATINQRELGSDTASYSEALRRTLRQDPDVILIGELRDSKIMEIAIEAAETGHLVLSTLHTNDSKQTLDRILDSFPPDEVPRIRGILSLVLVGIMSQRLLKRADGDGRVPAVEVLVNSPHIRSLLEEGNIRDLDKAMAKSSSYYRMQT